MDKLKNYKFLSQDISSLKGVGKNLQDHHEVSVIAKTKHGYGYFGQDKGFKMLKLAFFTRF